MTILWEVDEGISLLKELNQALHQANQSLDSTLERMLRSYTKHTAARWMLVLLVKDATVSQVTSVGEMQFTLKSPFSVEELPCWPELAEAKPVLITQQAEERCTASPIPLQANQVQSYLPIGEPNSVIGLIVIGAPTPPTLAEVKLSQLLTLQAETAIQQSRALKAVQLSVLQEYYDWLKIRLHTTVDQSLSSAASLTSLIVRLAPDNPMAVSKYLVDLEELISIAITDTHHVLTEFRGRTLMFGDEANHEPIKDKSAPS